MKDIQCIVHAGGKGTRLKPLTLFKPKPLLEVGINPKPLIYWSMLPAINSGIKDFLITTNYKKNKIKEYFDKLNLPLEIKIFEEPEGKELGRAGSTKFCLKQGLIKENKKVLMLNTADIIRNIIPDLIKNHDESKALATIVVAEKCIIPSSKVEYDQKTNRAKKFVWRPEHKWEYGEGSHVGMFLFEPETMNKFEKVPIPSDPERTVIQELIEDGKANVFLTDSWIPIKYSSDLDAANSIDIEKFQSFEL